MPNLLKLLRNNRKKTPTSNEKALEAIITSTVSADVVQDLTAISSTSKSSPSNSSSGDSDSSDTTTPTGGNRTTRRRKQFAKAGSQIFRRVKASAHTHLLSRRSSSGGGGGDEASHVSSITTASLHNNIDTPSGIDKLDTPTGRNLLASPLISSQDELLSSTCILKENRVPSSQEIASAISSSREKAALVNVKKEIRARDAKIRYLNTLVKELKSLYTQRLDMKEMELAAVREELETTVNELAAVKQDLVEAIEGHAQLVEDVAKKTREPNCWFSSLQFN